MIRGLDRFREHFAEFRKAFVLVGGVACHEWLGTVGLEFRATKDMDVVLIVEALDQAFVKRFYAVLDRHCLVERRGRVRHRAQGTALSVGQRPNEL